MYVNPNYRTKKELRQAVADGRKVSVYSPGPWPCRPQGIEAVEGPHYPEPHRWYARVMVRDGLVVKVIS